MATTFPAQFATLGKFATAKGQLGAVRSGATERQMAIVTDILTDPDSFGPVGTTVICVEDRLHRPDPRLAGGALSLALMYNFVSGGTLLSADLRKLKAEGFRLALHRDCGALGLVATGFVATELSNVNAEGYKLLGAMGYDVPATIRRQIAEWARKLPANYVDRDAAMAIVDEIDDVEGQHNAVAAAMSMEDGVSFIGGPRLKRETGGLLSFGFDPWIAERSARRLADGDKRAVARTLALVFTAQVFLTLGGPDLRIALHR